MQDHFSIPYLPRRLVIVCEFASSHVHPFSQAFSLYIYQVIVARFQRTTREQLT